MVGGIFFPFSKLRNFYHFINQLVRKVENYFQHFTTVPNVDVVLRGDECVLYLESKFSEYLGGGPVEVKKVDYYDVIYGRLTDTLKKAGVQLETKDWKRFLERED